MGNAASSPAVGSVYRARIFMICFRSTINSHTDFFITNRKILPHISVCGTTYFKPLYFNFNIHASRQVQTHQHVDGF